MAFGVWKVVIETDLEHPDCESHYRMPPADQVFRQSYAQDIWLMCWACGAQKKVVMDADGRVHDP